MLKVFSSSDSSVFRSYFTLKTCLLSSENIQDPFSYFCIEAGYEFLELFILCAAFVYYKEKRNSIVLKYN